MQGCQIGAQRPGRNSGVRVRTGSVDAAAPHVEGVRTSPEVGGVPVQAGTVPGRAASRGLGSSAMPGAAASRHASIGER